MPALLIMFLGAPGSGKTYFARRLAPKIGAVTLNADAMRLAVYGSLDAIERLRDRQPERVYRNVFRAMDYAARQALSAGHSVIYDSQQTKRRHRREMERLAEESGAVPILVWIQTDPAVADRRGHERESTTDTHQYTVAKMAMLMERFDAVAELPSGDERVIVIDGTVDFEEQYQQFQRQLGKLLDGST